MTLVFHAFPGREALARDLAAALGGGAEAVAWRRFPDGESLVRVSGDPAGRDAALVCGLEHPDEKALALIFAADTLRELGAASVGLVAPYLGYMRQDIRFHPGEAVSAPIFAKLLSPHLDWLVTVDPHLHRIPSLSDIYSLPSVAAASAPAIAAWIAKEVENPLLIGPDSESAQWVEEVARLAGAPSTVLEKTRRGDREVEISVPDTARHAGRVPVLVDDIISTARTMAGTVAHLRHAGLPPPVCIGVHAVFAGDALDALRQAGAGRIVTCDSIVHETNGISLISVLADAVRTVRNFSSGPVAFSSESG
jgi:ribose-phosphate pyrophosphokinase